MNGFEKHGLDHTSPSQINMWANAPCAWVARYLYDKRFNFALAAKAGILVEKAVVEILCGIKTEEEAVAAALKEYNKEARIGASSADLKRGEAIEGMITNAVAELKQYGEPEFDGGVASGTMQKKIELTCNGDGWKLPIIGYLDLDYPEHGLTVDLKTTMRIPSFMSDEHLRQGAIYKKARGNHAIKFLYVSGKKAVWHEVDDESAILKEVKSILNRQEKFLQLDKEVIKDIVPVNQGSYYWSDDEEIRQELYGI